MLRLHGEDKKLQRLAAACKESTFMDRYKHEAQTRPQRQALLRKHWYQLPLPAP